MNYTMRVHNIPVACLVSLILKQTALITVITITTVANNSPPPTSPPVSTHAYIIMHAINGGESLCQ